MGKHWLVSGFLFSLILLRHPRSVFSSYHSGVCSLSKPKIFLHLIQVYFSFPVPLDLCYDRQSSKCLFCFPDPPTDSWVLFEPFPRNKSHLSPLYKLINLFLYSLPALISISYIYSYWHRCQYIPTVMLRVIKHQILLVWVVITVGKIHILPLIYWYSVSSGQDHHKWSEIILL